MTKRLTQPSLKIKKQPTHQFNSLIKVLKPKVFITNSSNFKTLVQELTGNGLHSTQTPEPTHVIQIDNYNSPDPSLGSSSDPSFGSSPDPSLTSSPDTSIDNMLMPFDYSNCSSEELGLEWSQDQVVNYVNDFDLRNLESWLLDLDSSTCVHDAPFAPMNTYEYDYIDLASIL